MLKRVQHDKSVLDLLNEVKESMEDLATYRKRLLYQSQHRGMKELDVILGGFAQKHIPSMTFEELQEYEELLSIPDQEIYEWIFKNMPLSAHVSPSLSTKIRSFKVKLTFRH